ncbi:hypothetical protein ACFP1L_03330 [Lactiplantibacillus nangangensis]|uniref:WxL domain-containing protein n=1 Tax=Lactiplantibacillus nangangensis TaxID=2559917 RepID=A0ABW1SI33_9LACO|nr:hypothetical protein [Lactiplantibacillus nangangensis]
MIKQMSLIALGAATLFMAPTVVHAEKLSESEVSVNVTDVSNPNNRLESVSELNFLPITNQASPGTIKTTVPKGITVVVHIDESGKRWKLQASRENFVGTTDLAEGVALKSEKLELKRAGAVLKSATSPEHMNPEFPGDKEITLKAETILEAQGHSVGRHALSYDSTGVELNVPA